MTIQSAGVCPLTQAKHKWKFVKNVTISKFTHGPHGSHGTVSLRGLYECACGGSRIGKADHNAPGNCLRAFASDASA